VVLVVTEDRDEEDGVDDPETEGSVSGRSRRFILPLFDVAVVIIVLNIFEGVVAEDEVLESSDEAVARVV